MRRKLTTFSILAIALGAFAIAGAAKLPQNYQGQAPQDQSRPGTQGGMMGPGMMGQGQGTMGQTQMGAGMAMGMSMGMMMGQMSTHHDEIMETMGKVMQSMNAIQYERNENKLRSKMADHRALLQELQTELTEEGTSMKNMVQMMGGPAAAPSGPAPTK